MTKSVEHFGAFLLVVLPVSIAVYSLWPDSGWIGSVAVFLIAGAASQLLVRQLDPFR